MLLPDVVLRTGIISIPVHLESRVVLYKDPMKDDVFESDANLRVWQRGGLHEMMARKVMNRI